MSGILPRHFSLELIRAHDRMSSEKERGMSLRVMSQHVTRVSVSFFLKKISGLITTCQGTCRLCCLTDLLHVHKSVKHVVVSCCVPCGTLFLLMLDMCPFDVISGPCGPRPCGLFECVRVCYVTAQKKINKYNLFVKYKHMYNIFQRGTSHKLNKDKSLLITWSYMVSFLIPATSFCHDVHRGFDCAFCAKDERC